MSSHRGIPSVLSRLLFNCFGMRTLEAPEGPETPLIRKGGSSRESRAVGLTALHGDLLHHLLSLLGAETLATVACVSRGMQLASQASGGRVFTPLRPESWGF